MTAVNLPRSTKNMASLETYVKAEFRQSDQNYVMDCMINDRPIDYRNLV